MKETDMKLIQYHLFAEFGNISFSLTKLNCTISQEQAILILISVCSLLVLRELIEYSTTSSYLVINCFGFECLPDENSYIFLSHFSNTFFSGYSWL